MTVTTISFRADEQTLAELRQLAGDGNLSDAIRELMTPPAKPKRRIGF